MNTPNPVDIQNLSRAYGARAALNDISLQVTTGTVFGLVGENGAGKTTLLKHLLGLLRAQQGSVRVFGHDPVTHPVEVLSRIGYVAESRDLPGWMRVSELLRYLEPFYPTWDSQFAQELRRRFELDPESRIKNLSRGQLAKASLLAALAHRPQLLVLDEPSSGLDPIVRRDILEAIIRTVSHEGRTVIFSSHLLDEVERVSDQVAFLHAGRLVLNGPLDELKLRHHRMVLRFQQALERAPLLQGALSVFGRGVEWTVICDGAREQLHNSVKSLGAEVVSEETPSLDEIFVARTKPQEVP
jgi:ABC-type multidrug transport system ATPase subunit